MSQFLTTVRHDISKLVEYEYSNTVQVFQRSVRSGVTVWLVSNGEIQYLTAA